MTDATLEPEFAGAVRSELATIGTKRSRLERHQRRTRLALVGIIAIGIAAATTGAALVVANYPGSTHVAPLGSRITVTRTGTSTIELGVAALGANSVIIDVTCISATGNISVPSTDGFSVDPSGTSQADVGFTQWNCATRPIRTRIRDGYLAPGGTSITVTADAGTRWTATVQYAKSTTSPFGVNAQGQTYGQANATFGEPTLEGVRATNGKDGYVYTKQFNAFRGCGYLDVYASDGTTVIGKFAIGIGPAGNDCDASVAP